MFLIKYYNDYNSIISIIGLSNVGKSLIFNFIIKKNKSIVNNKLQYTRKIILSKLNINNKSILLIDNPGFLIKTKKLLHLLFNKYIYESINNSNILFYVTNNKNYKYDFYYFKKNFFLNKKIILFFLYKKNKIINSLYYKYIKKKNILFLNKKKIINNNNIYYKNIIKIINNNIKNVKNIKFNYKYNIIYNKYFKINEIIRNNIYLLYKKEIPYSTEIIIEKIVKLKNKLNILCLIYLEKKSQIKILIGKNGKMINKLSLNSRNDIKKKYKNKYKLIYIKFYIKINKWTNSYEFLNKFGYY
ncbi:MAG: 50S ribosome-binding GTPase [Candidatus Shikimatogenerans bostrichidophilus]|nr:MAG: 50S ribosome-binding GTPase [Candidatus Shikimatogenerans bostrichidophilus]